jgi:hypothetical protein
MWLTLALAPCLLLLIVGMGWLEEHLYGDDRRRR